MKGNLRRWRTEVFCPICGTEYRKGFTECSDCHVRLVNQLPDAQEAAAHKKPDSVKLVRIRETDNLADVTVIKLLLDSKGIEYMLQGETLKFVHPVDPVILFVREDDADRARDSLKEIKLNFNSKKFIPKKKK